MGIIAHWILVGIAIGIAAPALAAEKNLYGTTTEDFVSSPDRYAYPRSVQEYRRMVPLDLDAVGMCRNALHVEQCVWRLNGHQYPPPPDLFGEKITHSARPREI